MTNRVLLGLRSGVYGLWVSKPGVNVLTAGADDLLLATDQIALQVIASGVIADPGAGASVDISFTDLGIYPFVIFTCEKYTNVSIEYLSTSSVRFRTGVARLLTLGPTLSGDIRYSVTNSSL